MRRQIFKVARTGKLKRTGHLEKEGSQNELIKPYMALYDGQYGKSL